MYPAKLHVDTLLGLCNNTNPLPRGMEESRKGFQLGIKWSRRTGTLAGSPVVRVRGKPLPRALGAAVLPTASWGSCRGWRVALLSRRLSGASCFHLLAPYSLHSLRGRFPSWRCLSTLCVPGVPLCVLKPCSYRAAPDGFLLDSKMGVPPFPEANNGLRWGPVLLTVFLVASRGKVKGAWTLGQSTGRTQRMGWGRHRLDEHPRRPLQPTVTPTPQQGGRWDHLAGGSSVYAKCPGWRWARIYADGWSNSCLSAPSPPREPRAPVALAEQEMDRVRTAPVCSS